MMRLLLLSALSLLCGACTSVQAWQKGELAEAQMLPRRDGRLQFFEDHALSTLEQAEGANGKAGSGCGCR